MSEQPSAFVDVTPEVYLPAMIATNEVAYGGGLQATKMDVGGTEIMVYQEVDKSYLQEYLEEPVENTGNPTTSPMRMSVGTNTPTMATATDKAPQKRTPQKTIPPTNHLQCLEYPKILPNIDLFVQHVKRRSGEKPFACYICDYSTVNKTMFQEHLYMHQGLKPFKCKFCEHRSGSKKNLKKHEERHQDGYKLKCPNCAFLGRNKKSLNRHINFTCTVTTLTCEICDFTSSNKVKLEEHKKRHNEKMPKKKFRELTKDKFECKICKWSSKNDLKILLHLIHHPKQTVNKKVVDISILKEHGIMD